MRSAVRWLRRPADTGTYLKLSTRFEGGKIFLRLEANELDKTPITDLDIKAGISSPTFKIKDGKTPTLKFEQRETSGRIRRPTTLRPRRRAPPGWRRAPGPHGRAGT